MPAKKIRAKPNHKLDRELLDLAEKDLQLARDLVAEIGDRTPERFRQPLRRIYQILIHASGHLSSLKVSPNAIKRGTSSSLAEW